MQYAKSRKVAAAADIFNDDDLKRIEQETGTNKREQLALLNRKVKQFEEKVAREEILMRNRGGNIIDGGSGGSDAIFDAQSQVND